MVPPQEFRENHSPDRVPLPKETVLEEVSPQQFRVKPAALEFSTEARVATHSRESQVLQSLTQEDVESFPRFEKEFLDFCWIIVKSGHGGHPAPRAIRSYNQGKGPGYGGNGGSVYFRAHSRVESLRRMAPLIKGAPGGDGEDSHRGAHAKNLVIEVPPGTIIRERIKTSEKTPENRSIHVSVFKYQMLREYDVIRLVKGGRGGVGPRSFKLNDGRRGEPGTTLKLELELRLPNDVSFIGFPNSGKTSLLAALTRSHTRIGPEPLSTTRPHLGKLRFQDGLEISMLDLPGLSVGDYADNKARVTVLRHTYRSKILCFVIDAAQDPQTSSRDLFEEVKALRDEALAYHPVNAEKPWVILCTRCDMLHWDALFQVDSLYHRVKREYGGDIPVIASSARFALGLPLIANTLRDILFPEGLVSTQRDVQSTYRFIPERPAGESEADLQGYLQASIGDFQEALLQTYERTHTSIKPRALTSDEVKAKYLGGKLSSR